MNSNRIKNLDQMQLAPSCAHLNTFAYYMIYVCYGIVIPLSEYYFFYKIYSILCFDDHTSNRKNGCTGTMFFVRFFI
jgi:hypothetical protein